MNKPWCGYCGTQDFTERPSVEYPDNSMYSTWICNTCKASYELNSGYGFFTLHWGDNDLSKDGMGKYRLNTGELMDDSKLPRTPEGILRHSGSKEELDEYRKRTQVK